MIKFNKDKISYNFWHSASSLYFKAVGTKKYMIWPIDLKDNVIFHFNASTNKVGKTYYDVPRITNSLRTDVNK